MEKDSTKDNPPTSQNPLLPQDESPLTAPEITRGDLKTKGKKQIIKSKKDAHKE